MRAELSGGSSWRAEILGSFGLEGSVFFNEFLLSGLWIGDA